MSRGPVTDRAAIDSLKQRLQRDPLSRAFLQLAEEYRKSGLFDEAIRTCLEGLERHPQDHTARIALGRTYLEAGNLEAAGRTLAEVHAAMPEHHLAGKLLAEVQRRQGDRSAAAETYRAILRHYPGDREVEALLRGLLEPQETQAPPRIPSPAAAAPAMAGVEAHSDPGLDYRPEDVAPAAPAGRLESAAMAREAPPAFPASDPSGPERPSAQNIEAVMWSAPVVAEETMPDSGPADTDDGGEPDALQTNTLAELFLRQGLVDRATDVYRAMLRVDPGNDRARRRLAELTGSEPEFPAPPTPIPAPPASIPAETAVASPVVVETREAPAVMVEAADRGGETRAAIERLERWLRCVRGAGGAGAEAGRTA